MVGMRWFALLFLAFSVMDLVKGQASGEPNDCTEIPVLEGSGRSKTHLRKGNRTISCFFPCPKSKVRVALEICQNVRDASRFWRGVVRYGVKRYPKVKTLRYRQIMGTPPDSQFCARTSHQLLGRLSGLAGNSQKPVGSCPKVDEQGGACFNLYVGGNIPGKPTR